MMRGVFKKSFIAVITVAIICSLMCIFTACNPDSGSVTTMEKDLTYDKDSEYGLYVYDIGSGEYLRASGDMSESLFDKKKPTVIFFHGWTTDMKDGQRVIRMETSKDTLNNTDAEFVDYARALKEEGYNVMGFNWVKDSTVLSKIFAKIWTDNGDGHSLACYFAKEYATIFNGYHEEVTFLGHSYGTQMAVATTYLLWKMCDEKIITDAEILPSRITLADPYIGDGMVASGAYNGVIDNVEEEIGGRTQAELMADTFVYLKNKGIVIDVYCGMPMAYDAFSNGDEAKKEEIYGKLKSSSVWTVLEGLQKRYGKIGAIHNITLDWTYLSFFRTIEDGNGGYMPTAGLGTDEMKKLIGKEYRSCHEGLDLSREMLEQVK